MILVRAAVTPRTSTPRIRKPQAWNQSTTLSAVLMCPSKGATSSLCYGKPRDLTPVIGEDAIRLC